jgi:hypothetical protein
MIRRNLTLVMALLIAGTLAYGCSSSKKRVESGSTPKKAKATKMMTTGDYTVAKRDTLWDISGRSDVYGDHFQWPLIFKANRDLIKDPDLIYPNQSFNISKGHSDEEVAHARDLAKRTPKYVPHTQPRTDFGIDYF